MLIELTSLFFLNLNLKLKNFILINEKIKNLIKSN